MATLALAPADPALRVVRFTCADASTTAAFETVWTKPLVAQELARGWSVEVRESCEHAEEFERLVGERGKLATVVLDRDGAPLGVLQGSADARRTTAFLAACRERVAVEATSTTSALERIDARIALGAGPASLDAWREEAECAPEPALCERIARVAALRGELELARGWIARAGDSPRASVTRALIALRGWKAGEAVAAVRDALAELDTSACERATLLEIANELHALGEDSLGLHVLAALEPSARTQDEVDRVHAAREHLAQPNAHAHGG